MSYTKEEKNEILKEYYNSDFTREEICKKYELNLETFKSWIKKYLKENPSIKKVSNKFQKLIDKSDYKNMTNDELKLELIKKEIELERLKKNYSVETDTSGRKVYVSYLKKTTK